MRSGNFVLPSVSYPTLEMIIKAFYQACRDGLKEISTNELSSFSKKFPLEKEHVTIQEVSGSVSLLYSCKLIEKKEKYKHRLTELGIELGRAIKDHTTEQVAESWGKAIENSDFIKDLFYKYIRTVTIFKQDDLEKEILFRLNRIPKSNARTGALTIIDILEKARYVIKRTEGFDTQVVSNEKKFIPPYIETDQISSLRKVTSDEWDLKKLIKLCEEINSNYENKNYYSVGILVRAVLDHVPPIFGFKFFSEVANNYKSGSKSFKENMEFLEKSARKIADTVVHSRIKKEEDLLNPTQISFSPALDVLLTEITNILNKNNK